jgi:hypothetical protein
MIEDSLVRVWAAVLFAISLAGAGVSHAAGSGAARFPVIGCDDLRAPIINHYAWRRAPTGLCQTAGSLGTLEGIDRSHWRGWGSRTPSADGFLVDGLGFEYSAMITSSELRSCRNCFGVPGLTMSWYRQLHVVSPGGVRGGARRGPFNLTIDVTPTLNPNA